MQEGNTVFDRTPIINPRTGENIEPLVRANDGKVSLREFTAAHKATLDATAAKAKFAELDANKDGYLSNDEFSPKRKTRTKKETASR